MTGAGPRRPARPYGPIPTSAAVIAGWWLVAHSSGQGWVQALGDLVFGGLLVGLVGPSVALGRARVRVLRVPHDAAAGRPLILAAGSRTRVRVTPVTPAGPAQLIGPRRRGDGERDELVLLPARRGVFGEVVVDVATAAPFGLQWWTRRVRIPLPEPLHVAPATGTAAPLGRPESGSHGDGQPSGRRSDRGGDLRAPRPYRPGDARNRVHWPASAHTGGLMVRETEAPPTDPVEVTVTLPADDGTAERIAGDALATVAALLDRGAGAVLVTDEAGGRVRAPVADRVGAGRRLAAAVAAPGRAAGIDVARPDANPVRAEPSP